MNKSDDQLAFEEAVKTMIRSVGEEPEREGLIKTPERVFKAYDFMFGGYKEDPKKILESALFSSSKNEMGPIKDIELYSTCEHHLLANKGTAQVGE